MTFKMAEFSLYPPLSPYATGMLPVSDLHSIYYEESGNPEGIPVLYVHGGPGAGFQPVCRQFFNPKKYRIITFDQRGCGQSQPSGELAENTTADLVADMESLRLHLDVEEWLIVGGSWGSTLALVYAQTHAEHVKGLVLWGVFLGRQRELRWLFQQGAGQIFPEKFAEFTDYIFEEERDNLILAYHRRLTGESEEIRLTAARYWSRWWLGILTLEGEGSFSHLANNPAFILNFARISCHYVLNRTFLEEEMILKNVHRLNSIPGFIIQGRYDMISPPRSAYQLHKAWLGSELKILPNTGHLYTEPEIVSTLIKTLDEEF